MDIGQIQAYAYFGFTAFMMWVLYSYIFYLYKTQKSGEKDWEKYGKMALDDELNSKPIEDMKS